MVRERILSDDEVATLRGLWATAPSIGYAAKQIGICQKTARRCARLHGFKRPDPEGPWTPEKVEKLIELVKDGHSGGVIAAKLGVSRNSVIGKVTRLGLRLGNGNNPRPQGVRIQRKKAKKRKSHAPQIEFQQEPIPAPAADDIARVTFAELEPHHCRFGVGDPKRSGFGFCGLERTPGSPYCAVHRARCWTAVPVRTRPEPSKTRETPKVMS